MKRRQRVSEKEDLQKVGRVYRNVTRLFGSNDIDSYFPAKKK